MTDIESKRDSERISFNQRVRYGSEEITNTNSVSVNLSASGIAIKSYKAAPPGSKISLVIYCADKPLRVQGEVIWNKAEGPGNHAEMGIKIISRKDDISKLYADNLRKTST